jgi:hypothetical protein
LFLDVLIDCEHVLKLYIVGVGHMCVCVCVYVIWGGGGGSTSTRLSDMKHIRRPTDTKIKLQGQMWTAYVHNVTYNNYGLKNSLHVLLKQFFYFVLRYHV